MDDPTRGLEHLGGAAGSETYLDNASTSWPKAGGVWEAMRNYLSEYGASPGRGSYRRARAADQLVEETRAQLSTLLNAPDPRTIAFASNATAALNVCLKGFLNNGDHVVTTSTEHNSVLRPLEVLRRAGVIDVTVVEPDGAGVFHATDVEAACRFNTRLFAVNHASNVTGAVAPLPMFADLARQRDAALLVDAAQTAGCLPIDVQSLDIDMLVFTGHKCLLGPSGTGGMYIREPDRVRTLIEGGTGQNSHSLRQPAMMPVKFEAGTANYLGIAGLNAALKFVVPARSAIQAHGTELVSYSVAALRKISSVRVCEISPTIDRLPIVSLNVDGLYAGELAAILDTDFGIMTRAGLHCAPLMHKALGTAPSGTVRVSFGHSNTPADIDRLVEALVQVTHDRMALVS